MCYGVLGNLFSFGNCSKEHPKAKYSLNLSAIQQNIKSSVSKTNQRAKTEVGGSQVQQVTINGYISGAPDIIVTQGMNIKLANATKLSSSISDTVIVDAGNSMMDEFDKQINSIATSNPSINNEANKKITTNIKNTLTNILNSESTKKSIQRDMVSTLSVQNQNVVINFAQGVSDKIVNNSETVKKKFYDGRPVIEVDQNLVNNMLVESALKSMIGEIVNNSEMQKLTHDLETSLDKDKPPVATFATFDTSGENVNDNKKKSKESFSKYLIFLFLFFLFSLIFFFYKK